MALPPLSENEGTDPLAPESKLADTFLSTIDKVVKRLVKRDRVTRRIVTALMISFVLDVTLTIVIAVILSSTASNQSTLQNEQMQIRASALVGCTESNKSRADSITLWTTLLATPGAQINSSQGGNVKGSKQIQQFIAFLDKTYAPTDCQKLYG